MKTRPENDFYKQITGHIKKFKRAIINTEMVSQQKDKEGAMLSISYTVGNVSKGIPELIIAGLPADMSGRILNDISEDMLKQKRKGILIKDIAHPKLGKPIDANLNFDLMSANVEDVFLPEQTREILTSTGMQIADLPTYWGFKPTLQLKFAAEYACKQPKAELAIKNYKIQAVFFPDASGKFFWEGGDPMGFPTFGFL